MADQLVQNVELDSFQVGADEENVHWSGLVGDSAQPVAIQGPDRHGLQQRLVAQSQLSGHLPTDEAGVNSRVNQRD